MTDCFSLCLDTSASIVEVDGEEFVDSRTDERVCWRTLGSSGVRRRVTGGGLLCSGLVCLVRVVDLIDSATPGEYDDMEVGVEETLKGPGDSEYRVDGVVDRAYCGAGRGKISVGPTSSSYKRLSGTSISISGRARMEEVGGSVMPITVSENGSMYPPGMVFICCLSSWEDIDPSLGSEPCLPLDLPMLDGFLLNTLDRGLSALDDDVPDASEGVRVLPATSSLGSREEEDDCRSFLEDVAFGEKWVAVTEGVVGLRFCSFEWLDVGSLEATAAVGVTERCGRYDAISSYDLVGHSNQRLTSACTTGACVRRVTHEGIWSLVGGT